LQARPSRSRHTLYYKYS